MRNLAILGLLALELTLIGCGSSTPSTVKTANGTWESALIGSDAGIGVFNFITQFSVGAGGLKQKSEAQQKKTLRRREQVAARVAG